MGTVYVYFGKPINPDTSNALVHGVRSIMGEKNPQGSFLWDKLHLSISSGGGDVVPAFGAFNELKSVNLTVDTHNAGAVDSAAILWYALGKTRSASEDSSFFFHQLNWGFTATNLVKTVIADATKWLGRYEGMMADIVARQTKLDTDAVLGMMRDGTVVTPQEGVKMELVHKIHDYKTPLDARSWMV